MLFLFQIFDSFYLKHSGIYLHSCVYIAKIVTVSRKLSSYLARTVDRSNFLENFNFAVRLLYSDYLKNRQNYSRIIKAFRFIQTVFFQESSVAFRKSVKYFKANDTPLQIRSKPVTLNFGPNWVSKIGWKVYLCTCVWFWSFSKCRKFYSRFR